MNLALLSRLGGGIKRHRKAVLAGGGGAAVVSLGIAGLFMAKSFEPVIIMSNLYQKAFGPSERSEQNRGTRVLQRIFQNNRRNINDPAGGRRERTGNFVTDGITNSRLDRFETAIKAQGYEIVYDERVGDKTGRARARRAIAIETPDKRTVLDKDIRGGRKMIGRFADANFDAYLKESPRLTRMFATAVPGYKAVKRYEFRGMMYRRANVTVWYTFLDRTRNGLSNIRERLLGGDRDNVSAKAEVDGVEGDEDGTKQKGLQDEVDTGSAEADQVAKDTRADVEGGMSKSAAARKHASRLLPSGKSTAIALVTLGCLAKGYYDNAVNVDLEAYEARMAIAGAGLSTMSQQKDGTNVNLQDTEEFLSNYYDDETGEQYTQSATWKEATGGRVTGKEKDANYDYYYYRNGENSIVSRTGQFISKISSATFGLVGAICRVSSNFVVGWAFTGVEALAAGSVKAALAIFGGDLGIDWFLQKLLLLLAWPTGIADNGAVLNFAELGISMKLSEIEHSRDMGAQNLSPEQLDELALAAVEEQAEIDKSKGWGWRYFSRQNPRSLLATTAVQLPRSPKAFVASLARLPQTMASIIPSLLTGQAKAETAREKELHGVGFTDEAINGIDPVLNEEYVLDHLTYYCFDGEPCDQAKKERAIRMRTHVICTRYTYYQLYVEEDGKLHPECKSEPNDDTEAAGIWLLDRNLVSGLNQLGSDRELSSEMTAELVDKLTQCAKLKGRLDVYAQGCMAPAAYPVPASEDERTASIFDEPLQVKTFAETEEEYDGVPADSEFDVDKIYEDSTKIGCAKGTKNLGVQDGYHGGQKVLIRICAVSNFTGTGSESNGGFGVEGAEAKAVVNSRVSGAIYAMVKQAKQDGVNLVASSAFRTMAHQIDLCPCDGVSVAYPGYSNHQMGIAIDFDTIPRDPPAPGSNAAYDWLKKNAAKFGYEVYVNEAWHWSPSGH